MGEDMKNILVNQIGYQPTATKKVVFREENPEEFFVIKIEGDIKSGTSVEEKEVFKGFTGGAVMSPNSQETNYIGDFSSVTDTGIYYIKSKNMETSCQFIIGEKVYDDLFYHSLRFFYLQRCGSELSQEDAGKFVHKSCHDTLARIYGTDRFIQVRGGWHDAGDYGRYIVAAAVTVADLILSILFKPDLIHLSLNGSSNSDSRLDLISEIRYELDWMLTMQNKETGRVYHKVTCEGFPGFIMPENETDELVICEESVAATADFAACMALASDFYKEYDKDFSKQLLYAAKRAYESLDGWETPLGFKNPEGVVTGEYGDANQLDEIYWASAQLYKATGEQKYRLKFETMVQNEIYHGYGWEDVGSFGNIAYVNTKEFETDEKVVNSIQNAIILHGERLLEIAQRDGYGISFEPADYRWGSNMYVAENGNHLYDAFLLTQDKKYLTASLNHLDYLLGKNPMNLCYITGFGQNAPIKPHHRPSAAIMEPMKGMLVGGPAVGDFDTISPRLYNNPPAKCYADELDSYSTNEITIYWNSAFVYLLSVLTK